MPRVPSNARFRNRLRSTSTVCAIGTSRLQNRMTLGQYDWPRVSRLGVGTAWGQLHPEVLPQDSQAKQLPAGRIFVPQLLQSGASRAGTSVAVDSGPLAAASGDDSVRSMMLTP